jgi:hypothetical protein
MDGTTSAVNYLLSPTSNDYYDHHSLQPIQSLGSVPYYQSDALECQLYEHHKSDFHSAPSYIYHSNQQQQQPFGYGASIYDIQPTQSFAQESNLLLLSNQSCLPPVYELSASQTLPSTQLQSTVLSTSRVLKKEIEDTTTTTPQKNHVYEWMKGTYEK